MAKISKLLTIVSGILLITLLGSAKSADEPFKRQNIYKPPEQSNVDDIEKSPFPWVKDEFVPKIQEFQNNVINAVKLSPEGKKIWNRKFPSKNTRKFYFSILNTFFTKNNHPAAPHLANAVSKMASAFRPLSLETFFKAVAVNDAILLLSNNKDPNVYAANKYAEILNDKLAKTDCKSEEDIWKVMLSTCVQFTKSNNLDVVKTIDQLFEVFSSTLIVARERKSPLKHLRDALPV